MALNLNAWIFHTKTSIIWIQLCPGSWSISANPMETEGHNIILFSSQAYIFPQIHPAHMATSLFFFSFSLCVHSLTHPANLWSNSKHQILASVKGIQWKEGRPILPTERLQFIRKRTLSKHTNKNFIRITNQYYEWKGAMREWITKGSIPIWKVLEGISERKWH